MAAKQPTTHQKPPPPSPFRLPLSPRSQIRSPPPDARRIAAFGADKGEEEEEEADQTSGAEPEVNRHAFRPTLQDFRLMSKCLLLLTILEASADRLKDFQQQITRMIFCRMKVWIPEREKNAVEDDEAG